MSKHIVITAYGSLGDLHPMMALGMGLQQRGHRVTLAGAAVYREKIGMEGLGFHAVRPDVDMADTAMFERLMDPARGPEALMRELIFPNVRKTCEDLRPLLAEADFLVNSPLIMPGPMLAATMHLPWASVALQPFFYLSAYDPPVLPLYPPSEHWHGFGLWFWKPLIRFLKSYSGPWAEEAIVLREELGAPNRGNPIFEGQFSPHLNLALFSPVVGQPQPDWPTNTHTTGFLFYDRMKPDDTGLPGPIREFLEAGEPPVVFTLGSAAVRTAGDFYENAIEAARRLDCRAIFLTGENRPVTPMTDRMLQWDWAPYSQLFPHARAVVHQGGMGTTAQVLRAGKPMLVVPFAYDQPDNAARMKRLGVARTLRRSRCSASGIEKELSRLLGNAHYADRAKEVGEQIRNEDGVGAACRLIERHL